MLHFWNTQWFMSSQWTRCSIRNWRDSIDYSRQFRIACMICKKRWRVCWSWVNNCKKLQSHCTMEKCLTCGWKNLTRHSNRCRTMWLTSKLESTSSENGWIKEYLRHSGLADSSSLSPFWLGSCRITQERCIFPSIRWSSTFTPSTKSNLISTGLWSTDSF